MVAGSQPQLLSQLTVWPWAAGSTSVSRCLRGDRGRQPLLLSGSGWGKGLWPCSGEWGPEAGLASLLLPRPLPLPFPGVPDSPPLYS